MLALLLVMFATLFWRFVGIDEGARVYLLSLLCYFYFDGRLGQRNPSAVGRNSSAACFTSHFVMKC
jgi:hypothetical protein